MWFVLPAYVGFFSVKKAVLTVAAVFLIIDVLNGAVLFSIRWLCFKTVSPFYKTGFLSCAESFALSASLRIISSSCGSSGLSTSLSRKCREQVTKGVSWGISGRGMTSQSPTLCFLFSRESSFCEVWLMPAAGTEMLEGQCRRLQGAGGAGGKGGHSARDQRKPTHRTKCCCSRSGD